MPPEGRSIRGRFLLALAPRLGSFVIRLLGSSLRVAYANPEVEAAERGARGRVLYAFWHGWILVPCYTHRNRGITTLISQHFDGELIARTAQRLGFRAARGSTTRSGAAGLKAMCDAASAGSDLAIVPDGPRGPARTVQPGVVALASLTGRPVLPSAIAFSSAWRLNSWDRFVIPKPFSRVCIAFGEPIPVPPQVPEARYAEYQERIRRGLEEAEEKAQRGLEKR